MQAKSGQPPGETLYLGPVIVPFPELSPTIPASEPGSQYKCQPSTKKHVQTKSRAVHKKQTSAPIPFPEAHVRRTPSEHQLDQNERRAQYDIMKMNVRIATGKRLRAQIHPSPFLTKNPAQKPDDDKEAETEEKQQQLAPRRSGSGGWELAYVYIDSIDSSSLNPRSSIEHAADKLEVGGDDDIFSLEL